MTHIYDDPEFYQRRISEITEFLSQYGLREVKRWGQTKPGKCDVIFKKEQS